MIHCSINDCSIRAFTLVVGCPWRWFRDFLRNAEFWSNKRNSAKFRGISWHFDGQISCNSVHFCTRISEYVLYGIFHFPPRVKKTETKLEVKILLSGQ
jgi:hypothetical protein